MYSEYLYQRTKKEKKRIKTFFRFYVQRETKPISKQKKVSIVALIQTHNRCESALRE